MNIDVSLVMAACNPGPLLLETIESAKKSLRDLSYEVIVVNDQSDDQWCDKLPKEVTLINSDTRWGCSRSRSEGLAAARGDVLLISDPHCSFGTNSLVDLYQDALTLDTVTQPPVLLENKNKLIHGAFISVCPRGLLLGRKTHRDGKPYRPRRPVLHGSIYAMNRSVYYTLCQIGEKSLPHWPGILGGWEMIISCIAYRLGKGVSTTATDTCTHRQYFTEKRRPYTRPKNHRALSEHWFYSTCLPNAYQKVLTRCVRRRYPHVRKIPGLECAERDSMRQKIQSQSVLSEQWYLAKVCRIRDIDNERRLMSKEEREQWRKRQSR